ncbi:hypothetical protein [Brachybacterium alimentarium]|uniref:hypothetical protein n=1 Tax=Brachybacterium alimentarium TaxID=47845 RepID=UPI003FB968B0
MTSRGLTADERFYRWPPVKGVLSVALLLGAGFLAREIDDLTLVLAVECVLLVAAVYVWATTLSGFVRDLRPPVGPGRVITVASRPRRAAIALSWTGLVLTALAMPAAGAALAGPAPASVIAPLLAVALSGLGVATALPGLSRRRSAQAGGIGVSTRGVHVLSVEHHHAAALALPARAEERRSEQEIARQLERLDASLGPGVHWHPGAREAVTRWMVDGFLPSVEETGTLHLDPAWSPDPRSHEPTRVQRWSRFAINVWAAAVVAGFGAILYGALIQEGTLRDGNWFVLVVFGWMPVVGVPIFVVQAVRAVRRVRHDAGVSAKGWFDVLHGRGLIPFDQITGLRATADGLDLRLLTGTLTYPPREDTLACARRASRTYGVDYERRHPVA